MAALKITRDTVDAARAHGWLGKTYRKAKRFLQSIDRAERAKRRIARQLAAANAALGAVKLAKTIRGRA
jgi:hypothetical protein